MAIGNMYIPATLRVDAVGIWRWRIVDRNCIHCNIFAELRVDCPEGRVDDGDSFYQNIFTVHRLNKRRTQKALPDLTQVIGPEHVFVYTVKEASPFIAWFCF